MKVLVLSDHTSERIHQAEQTREGEYQKRLSEHSHTLARIRVRRSEADLALGQAWKELRFLRILGGVKEWFGSRLAYVPPTPQKEAPDRQEIVWAAGNQGEHLVMERLASTLDDSWVLIAGYHNRMGEIDLVAIGPSGMVSIETKYINGLVYAYGDQWYRDKYDKYGNCVEQSVPIADRRDRSPSRQLNECSDALEAFLHKRGIVGRIVRVVALAHPQSQLGTFENQTVDWVCTAPDLNLLEFCKGRGTPYSSQQIEKIAGFVQRDHEFNQRSGKPARSSGHK